MTNGGRSFSSGRLVTLLLALAASAVLAGQAPAPQEQPDFATWLEGVRAEALTRGISPATVSRALADVKEPEAVIVARDRAQPEQVQSLDRYVSQRVSLQVRRTARTNATKHARVLSDVEAKFGVSKHVVVAIWGLESNFGRFTGVRPTIASLATLAYDPRRSALFRSELFHALTIVDQGTVSLEELKGSWAGAMGQPQFMPSSYLKHAVDFDGDGKANIWTSETDVFASIANYLKNAGWHDGERWGREVKISKAVMARVEEAVPMRRAGCRAVREMTEARPLAEWTRLGVVQTNGSRLPRADMEASLVRGLNRHFLVYRNYNALIDYNCAHSYAISAGLLSDSLQ
jgi:membrane-bound lytic murein transglycosylase B